MGTQLVTIARIQKGKQQNAGPVIYVNQAFKTAFSLPSDSQGNVASFSIEGCLYRVRIYFLSDNLPECRLYVSVAAMELLGLKAGSTYQIAYKQSRQRFVVGYRKNIGLVSFNARMQKGLLLLLDWRSANHPNAGLFVRFPAFMIDIVILLFMGFYISDRFFQEHTFVLSLLLGWLYFAAFESSPKQATPGKIILGLRVTDMNVRRISFFRASVRFFAKILSAAIFMIGFLMTEWTENKQALHDKLTGCLVIKQQ